MNDEELVDVWESGMLGRAITHREHVRIAWLLISRHGREKGTLRISDGTLRNCVEMDAADRFDHALTDQWSDAIASAMLLCAATTSVGFIQQHPEFLDSELFGLPAWKQP